jgi:NADH-quinone oxidoreductase subunit L
MHDVPELVVLAPFLAFLLGFGAAAYLYLLRPDLPPRIAAAARPLDELFRNKWWFDELYDRLLVRPAKTIGAALWRGGDQGVIDRYGPDGVSVSTLVTTRQAMRLQTGYVYHYAFAMLIGVVAFITWYLLLAG